MRILLVTPSYYPNIGGVEYVVKSIAERLAALGHETTVVTGDPKADKPREEEINGVQVIRWPTWAPSGVRGRAGLHRGLAPSGRIQGRHLRGLSQGGPQEVIFLALIGGLAALLYVA